jgi:uncharacterized protein
MTPRPLVFLAWILLLSVPIYVWGIFYPISGLPYGLPGTAIMIAVPALVGAAMTLRDSGRAALAKIWIRIFDVDRIAGYRWLALALLTMPAATVGTFYLMRALDLPLPVNPAVDVSALPIAFAAYFAAAAIEEVGWTGYCTEPLQEKYGTLGSGLIIGGVWAIWHLVPWYIIQGHAADWVAGLALLTVLMRVVMVYLYVHGGKSLFLATLFHATINVSYSLFPNDGSHYDPVVLFIVLAAGVLVWTARTLVAYR